VNFRESFSVSLNGILSHKLRAFLTMLGIIFGVAAVIAMLSIGAGAKQEALDQIKLLGMNNVIFRSQPIETEDDERGTIIESTGLTMDDSRALYMINPLVEAAVPQKELTEMRVTQRSNVSEATVVGTTPEFKDVMSMTLKQGSFFNYQDVHQARRVCVLGSSVSSELFLYQNPIGSMVKVGDVWFTVIGVMTSKPRSTGKGGIGDRDMNYDVYMPLSTATYRYEIDKSEPEVDQIILNISDSENIKEASNIAHSLISIRHNNLDDFTIVVPEELLRQSQQTQKIFNIVMGAIAGISLLVGGIGIMNIMLATILERTREIGVRRAIGATRKDILGQFLIEAVLLSFTGGIVGILIGFIMTQVISSYANWKTIIEFGSIMLSFGVSVSVGIIFGIYPARKAAMLDPIESLRYE